MLIKKIVQAPGAALLEWHSKCAVLLEFKHKAGVSIIKILKPFVIMLITLPAMRVSSGGATSDCVGGSKIRSTWLSLACHVLGP